MFEIPQKYVAGAVVRLTKDCRRARKNDLLVVLKDQTDDNLIAIELSRYFEELRFDFDVEVNSVEPTHQYILSRPAR